jgi:hypothetical protein
MTQTAKNQTQTRTATTWRLGEREPIATKYRGSGQVNYWAVRVEWSEKRGASGSYGQGHRAGRIDPGMGTLLP